MTEPKETKVESFDFADVEIKRATFKLPMKHKGKVALFEDGTPQYVEVYGQYSEEAKFSIKDAFKDKAFNNKDDINKAIAEYSEEFSEKRTKQLVKDFKFKYQGKVITKAEMPVEEFLNKFPWLEEEILEASSNLENFTQD